ncbi:MAG: LytTR family DNA-binding domain-containing protein [Defluviitaleaceae bacterium]|nr:LytTR family DNA-binding domain-containing protein [Defluviitaleaceae bacterium]
MVYIAVCDDEVKTGAEIERALIEIFGKLNIEHEIDVFFAGAELCRKMESGAHYDLIFLDIEFAKGEINGVEAGRIIRDAHQNYLVSIVFISWEKKYAMQLFEIQPFNFIIKPLSHEKIQSVVHKYVKTTGFWQREFTYKIGHDIHKMQIKNMIYIESRDRKLVLHHADGTNTEFYGSLKNAYNEQLKQYDFLYIHNAYVVNYDFVSTLKFDQAVLADNCTLLPISKHRRNEVRARYLEIMKRRVM